MEKRIQNDLNKIIGITAYLEVICVDYYFEHGKDFNGGDFKGYTGTRYNPVSKQEVKHMNTLVYAKEYVCDAIPTEDIRKKFGSITKAAKAFLADMDGDYLGHDNSYFGKYGTQLDALAMNQQNIFGYIPATFTCCGGGRMFGSSITHDTKWALLLEPELLLKILEVEK